MSAAVFASASAPRAVTVTSTPSFASAIAQARPNPLLDAQTMAQRPLMPRSTVSLPLIADDFKSGRRTLANLGGPDKASRSAKNAYQGARPADHTMRDSARTPGLDMPLFLDAVDGRGDLGRQRAETLLAGGRKQRPQVRALQERRLPVGRDDPVEHQDQRDRDQADADRAKRCAAKAVSDAGFRADGFVQRHARQFSEHRAHRQERAEKHHPVPGQR